MRTRSLKPGFFANEDLAELEPLARLLFQGLWCLADREGRLEDRPKRIKVAVLPYDDVDANGLLDQLGNRGFIVRYAACEQRYIQVVTFGKHQTPNAKEIASVIPPPPGFEAQHDLENVGHDLENVEHDLDFHLTGNREPETGTSNRNLELELELEPDPPGFPGGSPIESYPQPVHTNGTTERLRPPGGPIGRNPIRKSNPKGRPENGVEIDPALRSYVAAREYGFHDNNPERTMLALTHVWINSGYDRNDFLLVLEQAVDETKARQMTGTIRERDRYGKMKGWPYCLQVLDTLISERKSEFVIPMNGRQAAALSAAT